MPFLPIIMKLGKNPWVIMGIALTAVIGYYNIVTWNLERTIENQKIEIGKLENNNEQLKINVSQAVNVNNKNDDIIKEFQEDVIILNENISVIKHANEKEILRLKEIIKDYNKKQNYDRTVVTEKCTIKIKEFKGDDNEKDSTILRSIGSIGF